MKDKKTKSAAPEGRISNALNRRLAERRRYRVRFWIITVLISLLVAAAVAGVVYLLFFSKYTVLSDQKVTFEGGEDVVTKQMVDDAVRPYVGKPLISANTGVIARNLQTEPWVESVNVSRHWPKGLKIVITLRKPVAVLPDVSGSPLIDKTGVLLRYREKAAKNLPKFSMPVQDGQADKVCLEAAQGVWNTLPAELQKKVYRIYADTADTVKITFDNDVKVLWGANADDALKLKVLQVLLPQGGKEIDISDPVHPSVI